MPYRQYSVKTITKRKCPVRKRSINIKIGVCTVFSFTDISTYSIHDKVFNLITQTVNRLIRSLIRTFSVTKMTKM